ncbi:img2 [Symbiodinium natans]|uniref:Large ribosomal subunit protein mL49 n=1 Tax=Symbiodinium natans TaxID=878477 RepID=A0A812Q9N9_9DINO|nr:img2 [Symbiodinium natans]
MMLAPLRQQRVARGLCKLLQRRWVFERRYRQKEEMDTKNLPFLVHRTPSGNLPVYVEPTQKGEKFTRIRRVYGDAEHLAREVGRLCDASARVGRGSRKSVDVLGVHEKKIKEWLHHLGL